MKLFIVKKTIILFTLLISFLMPINIVAQDIIWKKNFGGAFADSYQAVTTVSDGIVCAGASIITFVGTGDWEGFAGKGDMDAIIVKYNNAGDVVWKNYFGGYHSDIFNSLSTTSNGIVAVGNSHDASFGNGDWEEIESKGSENAIIVKYDNAGTLLWKKNFGGGGYNKFNSVTSVSDGVVAVGYSNFFNRCDWEGYVGRGSKDAIIVKYDNAGNIVWKKYFGGEGDDDFHSVTTVSDGIIAVGSSHKDSFGNGDWEGIAGKGIMDAIIVKYDNAGNIIWKKNFGGKTDGGGYESVMGVSDGIVAVGHFSFEAFNSCDWEGIDGHGGWDAIMVKYDHAGNIIWKKNFGGINYESFNSVSNISDNIIAAGWSMPQSFDTGDWTGIFGKGSLDAILVEFDHDGNLVQKKNFGGIGADYFWDFAIQKYTIIAVGNSEGASFGTGDWEKIPGKGGRNATIMKLTYPEVGIIEHPQEASRIMVYPNPTTGEFTIDNGQLTIDNVEIFDIYGRKMSHISYLTSQISNHQINISHLPAGIYFVKVYTEAGVVVEKVIKN